jgi:hypothetical protein
MFGARNVSDLFGGLWNIHIDFYHLITLHQKIQNPKWSKICNFVFFFVGLRFELRASHYQAGALPHEEHLQFILFWLFWK